MKVTCPSCAKTYALPDSAIQAGVRVQLRCKHCQNVFQLSDEMIAAGKAAEAAEKASAPVAPSTEDQLASLPGTNVPYDVNAPAGEATRAFIAASGANKRNPPWKIALFVLGFVGVPVLVLYLLSTFKIATVTVTNENGEQVEQPFFSGAGVSGLGDLLSGKEAERRKKAEEVKQAAVAKKKAEEHALLTGGGNPFGSADRKGDGTGKVESGSISAAALGNFYAQDTGKKEIAPKIKGDDAPQVDKGGGLDAASASKVLAQSQQAFQGCIENALRRNPNLKVGKIVLTISVAPSGAVSGATIVPAQFNGSDWGGCLKDRAKRLVFPHFDGTEATDLEVPLVVGVAM